MKSYSIGVDPHPMTCVCIRRENRDTEIHRESIMCWQRHLSSVQSLSCVRLFVTPWTAARQASLSITSYWSLLKLMSIQWVMPSSHLILCHLILLLSSIFPSIREIDVPKNWSFWTVVLEKTLESPLDCKIQSAHPKGNQSWVFIGKTEAEAPIFWLPDAKSWLIWKDPDSGKDRGRD